MSNILWLDLETTGVDIDQDMILEVGMVVTEGLDRELGSAQWVTRPVGFNPFSLDEVVYEMHSKSGLLSDLRRAPIWLSTTPIDAWLDEFFSANEPITVGGSGIDRFDIPMLQTHGWAFVDRFHWRTLDVSATKNLMKRAGIDVESAGTAHRAVDDARWAFQIAQKALSYFPVTIGA